MSTPYDDFAEPFGFGQPNLPPSLPPGTGPEGGGGPGPGTPPPSPLPPATFVAAAPGPVSVGAVGGTAADARTVADAKTLLDFVKKCAAGGDALSDADKKLCAKLEKAAGVGIFALSSLPAGRLIRIIGAAAGPIIRQIRSRFPKEGRPSKAQTQQTRRILEGEVIRGRQGPGRTGPLTREELNRRAAEILSRKNKIDRNRQVILRDASKPAPPRPPARAATTPTPGKPPKSKIPPITVRKGVKPARPFKRLPNWVLIAFPLGAAAIASLSRRGRRPAADPLSPIPFNPTTAVPQTSPRSQLFFRTRQRTTECRARAIGKCREGFFRETPRGTRYITWRTRDC